MLYLDLWCSSCWEEPGWLGITLSSWLLGAGRENSSKLSPPWITTKSTLKSHAELQQRYSAWGLAPACSKKMKKEEKDIGREGYYPGMQKKANIIKEMAFPAYSTPGEAAAWQVPREGGWCVQPLWRWLSVMDRQEGSDEKVLGERTAVLDAGQQCHKARGCEETGYFKEAGSTLPGFKPGLMYRGRIWLASWISSDFGNTVLANRGQRRNQGPLKTQLAM